MPAILGHELNPITAPSRLWLRGLAATFTELLHFSPDARSSVEASRQKNVEAALDAFGQRPNDGPPARTLFAATRSNGGVIRSLVRCRPGGYRRASAIALRRRVTGERVVLHFRDLVSSSD